MKSLPLSWYAAGAAIAVLLTVQIALLWPHWVSNPDLSHGFFTPLVFALLIAESVRHGTPRFLRPKIATSVCVAALLAGLVLLGFGGLFAAAVGWSHTMVVFVLSCALVSFLLAALATVSARDVRLVPFNWSSLVAVALWFLTAPMPPGTYTRLTLGLQLAVSENVVRALHLLGIAATRDGNVINLAHAVVGVEDACSGVRSLISCVFVGFFFSATLVCRSWARAVILLAAPILALAMNFARSLLLTLLANADVDIAGPWHDWTGFAVLGLTAAVLFGLARLIEKPGDEDSTPHARGSTAKSTTASRFLANGLAVAVAVALLFHFKTAPSPQHNSVVPDLERVLPTSAPGWSVTTDASIYQFRSTLQTDTLLQRTYLKHTPAGIHQVTVYLAYWRAGQASVSSVSTHTPDACWPGSGWVLEPQPVTREVLATPGGPLPAAEARLFRNQHFPQYVWFWHFYDGRLLAHLDPRSPGALLKLAWNHGFSREGDQLFVRISSNHPWSDFANDPLAQTILSSLRPLGF